MIHCLAGIASGTDSKITSEVYQENLHYAGTELAKNNLTLLIEPINPFDMPGYYLNNIYQAKKFLDLVDLPNLKLQFDFYHIERVHGNSLAIFKEFANHIGHIQIADVPGRHEPGSGNMNYQGILQYLHNVYEGYIGLEYIPNSKSEDSFAWLEK
jgi:hydroxypyruvate isomerase